MAHVPTNRSASGIRGSAGGVQAAVDGWRINVATLEEAIERLVDDGDMRESFTCFTLNLDHLVKLRSPGAFQRAYQSARYITADGQPVARLARRQCPHVQQAAGSDMLIPLCEAAAERGVPVYLFGTSKEVLETTIAHLAKRTGGKLKVAGHEAPPAGFDPEGEAADRCIDRIAASGAGLCLVMLGAPKQEIFSARAVERGARCGFVCVGAAADFIAGHQARAPRALQSAGLEWAWRLALNPRRLAVRYAKCAVLLARIEVGERLAVRSRAS